MFWVNHVISRKAMPFYFNMEKWGVGWEKDFPGIVIEKKFSREATLSSTKILFVGSWPTV